MTYVPKPINTDGIDDLPPHLEDLIEQLAKNVHEEWAQKRIEDGWSYGPERSGIKRHHPGLVPYADLSEGEKACDSKPAIGTLKLLLSMGYVIHKA